jgi:hypothetical protein
VRKHGRSEGDAEVGSVVAVALGEVSNSEEDDFGESPETCVNELDHTSDDDVGASGGGGAMMVESMAVCNNDRPGLLRKSSTALASLFISPAKVNRSDLVGSHVGANSVESDPLDTASMADSGTVADEQ